MIGNMTTLWCKTILEPSSLRTGSQTKRALPVLSSPNKRYLLSQRHIARAQDEKEVQGFEIENPESETAQKKAEADRLRAAERFMVVGTGEAECQGCGYIYKPAKGDPEYPVAPGVKFQNLPDDWNCPVCGAEKSLFKSRQQEVAGFAENQGYGLGTNSMTGEQKSLLIYGSLLFFFALFLLGYTLN